jgi:hypothetical protein
MAMGLSTPLDMLRVVRMKRRDGSMMGEMSDVRGGAEAAGMLKCRTVEVLDGQGGKMER